MKKLESLGKRLTKNEQKKIVGGVVDPGGGGQCGDACSEGYACVPWLAPAGTIGRCHLATSGSNAGKCFCTAAY